MSQEKSIKPEIIPVTLEQIQDVKISSLSNNVPVYLVDGGNEDILKIDFIFRAGLTNEELPLQSSATVQMLTEGSESMSADEIKRQLDYYGIIFAPSFERDYACISLIFLNKYIQEALGLCSEIIFRPRFPEEELKALMNRKLQWFLIDRERVSTLATEHFFESIFGKNHPYGARINKEDFTRITPYNLRDFHSKNYTPSSLSIIVSGKIHPDTVKLLDNTIGKIIFKAIEKKRSPQLPYSETTKKTDITRKEAVQSALRIGMQTIRRTNPEFPALQIVNTLLGGYFGSRLMKNLREIKGYTYGISSYLVSLELSGYIMIATEVGKKHKSGALNEIIKEIKILQKKPVQESELQMLRNYMMSDLVRMFDGPFATAESFRTVWESGLDFNYYLKLADKIRTITPDEIIHIARTYYNIDDLYVITAG